LGSSLPAMQFVISDSALRSFVPTVVCPSILLQRDHPLTGLPSFSEFVRPWPSPALRRRSLPWGYNFPLRDINHKQRFFMTPSLPSSTSFASLTFHTPSTLFAAHDLVDLFHSTATCRICLQGFLPLTRLPTARRCQPFPLVVSPMMPNSSCPLSPAPPDPPSGLCPVRESVPLHIGYSPIRRADPLLVFPPPGFHPKQRSRAFTRFATLHLVTRLSQSCA